MSNKLTAIKLKYPDGTYSNQILLSVLAENVKYDENNSIVDVLNILDARIDQIVAPDSDSVTLDEEVRDIRIGADATTYSSAGNAVRGQITDLKNNISSEITDLKSAISDVTGNTPITMSPGYVVTSGDTVDVTAVTPSSTREHAVVPCSDGDAFVINTYGDSSARAFCFVSSAGVPLYRATSTTLSYNNYLVYAPKDSAYLVINNRIGYQANEISYKGVYLTTQLSNRDSIFEQVVGCDVIEYIKGYYINTGEATVDVTAKVMSRNYMCAVTACQEGDVFSVRGYGASAGRLWAFANSSGTILSAARASDTTSDFIVIKAPANSAYLILNSRYTTIEGIAIKGIIPKYGGVESAWVGKKIAFFGDSRTWYDGNQYTSNTKPEYQGNVCVGYQQTVAKMLGCTYSTFAQSSLTSSQLCNNIITQTDLTDYDAAFLCGGVNDFIIDGIEIGSLKPIGSTFDSATIYGAWQTSVEYILNNYPSVKIYMDVPPIAWKLSGSSVYPYYLARIKRDVAELYNIPCVDLYMEGGINSANKSLFYCDSDSSHWFLHFNDYGNEYIGEKIAGFLASQLSSLRNDDLVSRPLTPDELTYGLISNKGLKVTSKAFMVTKDYLPNSAKGLLVTSSAVKVCICEWNGISFARHYWQLSSNTTNADGYHYSFDYSKKYKIYIALSGETDIYNTEEIAESVTLFYDANYDFENSVTSSKLLKNTDLLKNTADRLKLVMRKNYDLDYANAAMPLDLSSPYGDIQNVHPKVLYISNNFAGHRYWMAYTPYPWGDETKENPCIAFSDDGYEWTNIPNNPIDVPSSPTTTYFSDTHLVYRSDTNVLECWYRLADTTNMTETIYRKTSTDGITWSTREELTTISVGSSLSHCLSPAAIWDGTKYHIWYVYYSYGGTPSENNQYIKYCTSTNGNNWTNVRDIKIPFVDNNLTYRLWHLDVIIADGKYILLAMCKGGSAEYDNTSNQIWTLFLSESVDNITYSTPKVVVYGNAEGWDKYMYRSSIVKVNDVYMIYYSALDDQKAHRIGISTSKRLTEFVGEIF